MAKKITKKSVQANEKKPFVPHIDAKGERDEGPFDEEGLSVRHRKFVTALIGPAGGNATKAAEMAGYQNENRNSLYVTASWILSNPKVSECIQRALARQKMSPEWAKERLIYLATSSMDNFLTVGEDGKPKIDMAKARDAAALGTIKELTADILPGQEGEQELLRLKIKTHDPVSALTSILKMHGLLRDVEPDTPDREIRVRRVKKKNVNTDTD